MKKILPYKIPTGETYQSVAFILGIIQSNDRSKSNDVNDFCTFRIHPATNIEIDIKMLLSEMENYY